MLTGKRSFRFLSMCSLLLSGCETANPHEAHKVTTPVSSLKVNKTMQPNVAQAFTLLKEGKYSDASSFINQALQSEPKSVILHILNALTYEKLAENGDLTGMELAVIGYQNALNLDPFNSFGIIQLGKIRYRDQQYDEAQEHFANALLIKPNDPDLIHEFAAASYYAYDIKSALASIKKAEKLKPEDPLIQRSASMMYAAAGDFKNAEKHFKLFQAKVGQDSEVAHVANRFNDWQSLYKSGRLTLAAAQSDASPPSSETSTKEDSTKGTQSSDGETTAPTAGVSKSGSSGKSSGKSSPPSAPKEQPKPQIIMDCYILKIVESANTSKGNNILQNLAVTLNPGSYTAFKGSLWGSGVGSKENLYNPDKVTYTPDSGYGLGSFDSSTGKPINNPHPSETDIALNNSGSISGQIFTAGVTWAGLTYSLNIANAADARVEIVSRPTLMAFLTKESRFFSGEELVNVSGGNYGSNLSRYQVGVSLAVTPESLVGDRLKLNIGVESSILETLNPNLQGTVTTNKTRVETTVRVRLGETIMLGGLYQREELQGKNGFPGLSDIPLLQYFVSNESTASSRTSVMILLTPRSADTVKSAVNRAMTKESIRPHFSELVSRNPDWFNPDVNAISIFSYINLDPVLYYEFRTGDILPPSWSFEPALSDKLAELSSFLYN